MTPKTKISPAYRHQRRHQCIDSESDNGELSYNNRNNHAADSDDTESEVGVAADRTLQRSYEIAPSSSDLADIERKMDLWSRQLNSNIMVWCIALPRGIITFAAIIIRYAALP